ncbi:MAG: carbamoyl phosphate synthase small subunit, partial [Acidimicrobiia bacterium]|nr:carbamoyl phosphate synthase small subunit [Acidimicrobiia bacterium]
MSVVRGDALAVTADGEVFRGRSVGADGIATGEVVFNTAMAGYQEIFSDPSYAGQVVVMTAPHIGNYGVTALDEQADRVWARGVIVRSLSRRESNWRSQGTLADYLRGHGLVGMSDVDTRRLTRHIRDRGAQPIAMGAGVTESELHQAAGNAPGMAGMDLATRVSTAEAYDVAADGESRGLVVAI